jgi:hypothetical protein
MSKATDSMFHAYRFNVKGYRFNAIGYRFNAPSPAYPQTLNWLATTRKRFCLKLFDKIVVDFSVLAAR